MMQKSAPDSYRSHSGPARRLFSSSFHTISRRSVQKNGVKENVTSYPWPRPGMQCLGCIARTYN